MQNNYKFRSLIKNSNLNENNKEKYNPENLHNIILETIKNNPNNIKAILPVLVKIITKNGLLCDFPFVYKNEEYHDKCVLFPDNKFYCKVNAENPENMISSQNIMANIHTYNRLQEFVGNFLDEKSKIVINKSKDGIFYYDECLNLDETQRYLNDIVEENFDFRQKILLDLYSDINVVIKQTQQEKLNLLFNLMENYCKNKKFDFDCIYENLILPISKSKELNILSEKILKIFKNYQTKLKTLLERSISEKFKLEEYLFIKEESLNRKRTKFSVENFSSIFEDEDQNTISLNLINSKNSASKISINHFFKILSSIYNICIEDCKLAIDYLFVDNFENDFERIKLEIVAYLFKIKNFSIKENSKKEIVNTEVNKYINNIISNKNDINFEKDFFDIEKNVFSKIFTNSTHINFLNVTYPIYNESNTTLDKNKNRLVEFLDYKKWSVRYTIHIIFRYLIAEKSFFEDYILNYLSDFNLNKYLKKPEELIDKNQVIRLIKTIPLIMPYYSFSKKMHLQQTQIYENLNKILEGYYDPLIHANQTISRYKDILKFINDDISERIQIIDRNMEKGRISLLNRIKNLDDIEEKLMLTKGSDSIENKIKLNSYLNNLDYITNNIFRINYFSHDCHKFIHYNTYFGNYTFGKPIVHYASLGYKPYFYIEFETDIQIYFIYSYLKFNTVIPINYTITISTNSMIDLYLDGKKFFPDSIKYVKEETYYDCLIKYNFTYISPSRENSHIKMKIKGNFGQRTNLIDQNDFYIKCTKKNSDINKFLDFNISKSNYNVNKKIFYKEKIDINHLNFQKDIFSYDKCLDHQFDVTICFDYNSYVIDCQIATKYLSEAYKYNLKEKLYVKNSEKILNKKVFFFESDEYQEYLKNHNYKNNKKYNEMPSEDRKNENLKNDDNTNENGNIKQNKNKQEEYDDPNSDLYNDENFIRDMGLIFMKKAERFCFVLQWDIPTYKCIYRNIGSSQFDSILLKCGAFGLWDLVGRNSDNEWLTQKTKKIDLKKIIVGQQFYLENPNFKIDLHFLPYITPSFIRPLSNINFFLNFNFTNTDEYLFASGDMDYFTVFEKKDLFVKGYPYNSLNSFNFKLISNIYKHNQFNYEASIFNPPFDDENFNNEGIVIFGNKVYRDAENSNNKNYDDNTTNNIKDKMKKLILENKNIINNNINSLNYDSNFVYFSFNEKFSNSKNKILKSTSEKILRENKGANIFIKKSKLCLSNTLYYSNLSTKRFYVEKVILTKFIFAYYKSEFLIFKLPKFLDKNSVLLRTSSYQTAYNLILSQKTRVYFAIEINDFIEINASILINERWNFIKGSDNIIEILTSDTSEDILNKKGEFKFYDCIFSSNINPKCKDELYKEIDGIKMSIFYKDFEKSYFNIKYNFMDFDSLYGSMHLLIMEPLECQTEKHNLNSFNDNVDNYVFFNYEYLPTFNINITHFKNLVHSLDYEIVKSNKNVNRANNIDLEKKEIISKNKLSKLNEKEKEEKDKMNDSKNSDNFNLINNFFNETHFDNTRNKIMNEENYDENIILSFLEFKLRDLKIKDNLKKYENFNMNRISNKDHIDGDSSSDIDILGEKIISKNEKENVLINNLAEKNSLISKYNSNKNSILNDTFNNNSKIEIKLGDNIIILNRKNQDEMMKILDEKFNITKKETKSLDRIDISKQKQNLIIYYLEKNYTSPKIRANSGGCLFSLDRFGNLFLKKIGKIISNKITSNNLLDLENSNEENNSNKNITCEGYCNKTIIDKNEENSTKNNEDKWILIKTNVKYFDLSENILLIMGFDRMFQFQLGISQESECIINNQKWKNLRIDGKNKIDKFSLSSFDCLWLYDEKNILLFIDKFSFFEYKYNFITPVALKDFIDKKIKNIYQYMDNLYIITRDNKIYLKKNIFDFERSDCLVGDVNFFFII